MAEVEIKKNAVNPSDSLSNESSKADEDAEKSSSPEELGASEEPQAYFEPVVQLEEIEVVSGEEGEDVIFKMRGKLFSYRETLLDKGSGTKSWCERGVGDVRFLQHKETGKVRALMRQEKTHKIIINHLVDTRTVLSKNMGSDRAWVWSCYDFSNGEVKNEVFALRFANAENAKAFKEAYDNAQVSNGKVESGGDAAETSAGDEAADALGSLKVKENTEKETTPSK